MTIPHELFRAGSLGQAIEAAAANVKASPADTAARAFYAELLCFDNQLERADAQLETMLRLDASLAVPVGTWRQLIRAAHARADVFERGAAPSLTGEPSPRISSALKALTALRGGEESEAAALCRDAEAARQSQPRHINGRCADDVRDLDDLGAGYLEVLATNGTYYWIDMDQAAAIELEAPRRPLDLLWRPATLVLLDGTEGKVFLPVIYPTGSTDEALKLGRETDWIVHAGVHRGVGQKMWLVGEDVLPLQDIATVEAVAETIAQQGAV